MSEKTKNRMLAAIRSALGNNYPEQVSQAVVPDPEWSPSERLDILKQKLEAVQAEVHLVTRSTWGAAFLESVRSKPVRSLLYAEPTEISDDIISTWEKSGETTVELVLYDQAIETFKERLFQLDAAVTMVKAAIAENGALVLWPDTIEPRLMSLVPPIHFAVLKASTVFSSFNQAILAGGWRGGMPANLVMVSGPSKTADIELVLAYGVHGPKEVVVFIVNDC